MDSDARNHLEGTLANAVRNALSDSFLQHERPVMQNAGWRRGAHAAPRISISWRLAHTNALRRTLGLI
jgi:hypothetical protein